MTITGSLGLTFPGDAYRTKGLALGMGVLPKMGKVVQMNFWSANRGFLITKYNEKNNEPMSFFCSQR